MRIVDGYNNYLKKFKIGIIVLWVAIIVAGGWFGLGIFNRTENVMEPPSYTDAYIAQQVLIEEFPDKADDSSLIILIRAQENESILTTEAEAYALSLINALSGFEKSAMIETVYSYYAMMAMGQPDAAANFISESERTTMIVIFYDDSNDDDVNLLVEYLRGKVETLSTGLEYETFLSGLAIIDQDYEAAIVHDIKRMDAIALPLALIVLALVLRRFRLMLIPLLAIGLSIVTSFIILNLFTYTVTILSFAPSIVMALVLAISIDYSLFLLSRYREEIEAGKDNISAVELMTEHAGHTLVVSGITLAICFAGLMFFPVSAIASLGLAAGVTVVVTLAANMTFTPAMLLLFGKFFSSNAFEKKIAAKIKGVFKKGKKVAVNRSEIISETTSETGEAKKTKKSNVWVRITKFSQKYSWPIIILIIVLAVPISTQVMKMDLSLENKQILPRNTDTWEAYSILEEEFKAGQLAPYYLIIRTNETNGVKNDAFFTSSQYLVQNLTERTDITDDSFVGVSWANNIAISWQFANLLLNTAPTQSFAALYQGIWSTYVTADNSTAVFDIITPFDPQGNLVEDWVEETRAIMEEFEEITGYEIFLAGSALQWVDSLNVTLELLPYMILAIAVIVCVLIGIMFRSALIPLQLLVTVGLTVSWIFGLAVLVFETGILDWMFPSVLGSISALYWIGPIVSFSIVLGLGLDYEIFLVSRIIEFRKKGYSDKAAIIKGVEKTGGIITAAGIIMAIASSGLMLSSEMIINQMGFILCFAVIVDTFVIRTILVPAIMTIFNKWNWWPGKMPVPTKDVKNIEDD